MVKKSEEEDPFDYDRIGWTFDKIIALAESQIQMDVATRAMDELDVASVEGRSTPLWNDLVQKFRTIKGLLRSDSILLDQGGKLLTLGDNSEQLNKIAKRVEGEFFDGSGYRTSLLLTLFLSSFLRSLELKEVCASIQAERDAIVETFREFFAFRFCFRLPRRLALTSPSSRSFSRRNRSWAADCFSSQGSFQASYRG